MVKVRNTIPSTGGPGATEFHIVGNVNSPVTGEVWQFLRRLNV